MLESVPLPGFWEVGQVGRAQNRGELCKKKKYRFLAVGRVAEVMAALGCVRGARGLRMLYFNCENW